MSGAGGVGGVRVVASSETGTTEGGVADGMQGRERKHNKMAFFLVKLGGIEIFILVYGMPKLSRYIGI